MEFGKWREGLTVECEELGHGNSEALGHSLQSFKRRRIPTTLNEAKEIHRDVEGLRELLLSHLAADSHQAESLSKLLP